LLIERIQRKNPFFITQRQVDQLLTYIAGKEKWTKTPPAYGSDDLQELEEKLAFERKCGTCHTLDILFMPYLGREDWTSILQRMGAKEPDFLSVAESLSFLSIIEGVLGDKDEFLSDFPHSTMMERNDE